MPFSSSSEPFSSVRPATRASCRLYLNAPWACAARNLVHLEYFYDHVRIEQMLFDGARSPVKGALTPDLTRPGMGLELKRRDAECYAL